MSDCGCQKKKRGAAEGSSSAGEERPTLEPTRETKTSTGENAMSETKPTVNPPSGHTAHTMTAGGAGTAVPTLTPSSKATAGGITAWDNKRVVGLWTINQNRNSWVYLADVGWKKLADNSDSAVVALSILAAHAKQAQTNCSYREDGDRIREIYVW